MATSCVPLACGPVDNTLHLRLASPFWRWLPDEVVVAGSLLLIGAIVAAVWLGLVRGRPHQTHFVFWGALLATSVAFALAVDLSVAQVAHDRWFHLDGLKSVNAGVSFYWEESLLTRRTLRRSLAVTLSDSVGVRRLTARVEREPRLWSFHDAPMTEETTRLLEDALRASNLAREHLELRELVAVREVREAAATNWSPRTLSGPATSLSLGVALTNSASLIAKGAVRSAVRPSGNSQ